MSDPPVLPPRPDPPRRPADTVAAWLAWVGPVRLVTTAVSVVVVAAGVAWLVRPASPPTEAGLPMATVPAAAASVTPGVTLPVRPATAPDPVVVHVAGAVRRPGVYELPATARVHAGIDAAGGATASADLDGLNLAAGLADGQRIYVPEVGEVDPAAVPSAPTGGDAGVGVSAAAGPVDLNRATASELEALPGVGPATAAAIVDDRERNGPFSSVDDLDRVSGIGPAKLAALRDLVTV